MKSDSQETSNPTKDEEENKYILGNDVENFFDSLFNRGGHPNVDRRYLKTTVPDDNESVTLKLINSKLVCYPKKEYKIPPPNDNESYEYYIPGVKGSTSILFPAFSSLNVKEQNILYRYHSLMFYNVRVLTEQETAEFKELMNKANIDYPAYQSFVYNQWIHLHAPRVRQIPPGVKLYTEYLWHTKAEQCLQLFPNYYKTLNSTIPLTLNDPHEAYAVMDFVRHVFVRGTPARMSLPSVKSPCELLTDFRDLCKIKPVAVEDKDLRVNPVIRQRVPISMDSFVEYCMNREPNIDVVITNSGIKTIVDIDRFKKDWILPVTIKNVPLENGEIKKIVIIDKKLPTNVMSVHDHKRLAWQDCCQMGSYTGFFTSPSTE
ncbi:uncharacterized protein LOC124367307 [Homalodisca vitripennis]|uniref:uncharacterized protein LOC124367307 n=1 Tax=Homalodisca vitripennis TaxID=197043 RepID=UPI001EECE4B6|nr:uncharacterized protein LOC124367307 [Homalodisca vitripennis]